MIYNLLRNYRLDLQILTAFTLSSLFISSIQNLYNKVQYSKGLLKWFDRELHSTNVYTYWTNKLSNILYSPMGFISINLIRIITIFIYYLDPDVFHNAIGFVLITILSIAIHYRTVLSNNSSNEFNILILVALSISSLANVNCTSVECLCFIAVVSVSSYVISGIFKIREKNWLNGTYLKGILSTHTYSNECIRNITASIDSLITFKILSRLIIFWEVLFVLCPFLPFKILLVYLLIGILFHIAITLVMGLNTFFWTFVGSYPAIIFLNIMLRG